MSILGLMGQLLFLIFAGVNIFWQKARHSSLNERISSELFADMARAFYL